MREADAVTQDGLEFRATEYACTLGDPRDLRNTVEVVWTGKAQDGVGDLWKVRVLGFVANATGELSFEPIPSERSDEYLAAHRFPFRVALEIAAKVAREAK